MKIEKLKAKLYFYESQPIKNQQVINNIKFNIRLLEEMEKTVKDNWILREYLKSCSEYIQDNSV